MAETTLKKISQIDDELLREVVSRIINAVHPDRIVLFGSYAYGRPKDESDLDILVIMPSELPGHKRSVSIYRVLAELLVSIDVVVYTKEEIEEWSEVPQAFITTILKKGKVIYEKK